MINLYIFKSFCEPFSFHLQFCLFSQDSILTVVEFALVSLKTLNVYEIKAEKRVEAYTSVVASMAPMIQADITQHKKNTAQLPSAIVEFKEITKK